MESLAVVIPFPVNRVRKPMTRKTQVFNAVLDEARSERATRRMLMACVFVAALLSVVIQVAAG